MTLILRYWQIKAMDSWINANFKGLIEGCTGSGKTYLGLRVISDNIKEHKILVVVPTVQLMNQWHEKIINEANIDAIDIGRIGGGHATKARVDIAVINSIRGKEVDYDVLILDECHNYLSNENIKLLLMNKFKKILGLSATIKREDNKSYDKFDLKVVFTYEQDEAIKNGDLSSYDIINIGVKLYDAERKVYEKADITIKKHLPSFPNFGDIFKNPWSPKKTAIRRAITARRTIVAHARDKILETVMLIDKHKNDKVIVFSEYIKTVTLLSKLLTKHNILHAVFHSKIKDKYNLLENFKNNKYNVLLSVKALDEGLDVPESDVAIIIAGTKTHRQTIQRAGRILRKKEHPALLYQLYCLDTIDKKNVLWRLKALKGYNCIKWH